MTKSRNNHYVPQWYQEGFIDPGAANLFYLDMSPPQQTLADGRVILQKARFRSSPSQCFRQRDLYSTFFQTTVNDEIERMLFGPIDAKGAAAVRAFIAEDASGWVRHFQDFFSYIDAQKLRTPKGLDWLKAQYPSLEQNELMYEMQGIRLMHCAIWSGGVREIVSAADSDIKFIVTDHPVTTYNHALPPDTPTCRDPHDPGIALKATQTIFALDRNHCLILSNLEYARDPSVAPLQKRTFARHFQSAMVKADALIRERRLTSEEVCHINMILKRRARRYIAAGREEWLHPEAITKPTWRDLRKVLEPPKDRLYGFGGEIFVSYTDGTVDYQDEFGRKEKTPDFLVKQVDETLLGKASACGCGSGKQYGNCCHKVEPALRRSWKERSIRERNVFLQKAIVQELGLHGDFDWAAVREAITDENIKAIYSLFAALWPRETDLLDLLPKPDGRPRAVYTGSIHPASIPEFALAAPLYFGEVLIEHPFVHAGALNAEFSPTKKPHAYRQEFLKTVVTFFMLMPLVEAGLVCLFPDPMAFDIHLRDQIMHMAKSRLDGLTPDRHDDPRLKELMEQDARRAILSLPAQALAAQVKRIDANISAEGLEQVLELFEREKREDPLAVLQPDTLTAGNKDGLLSMYKLAPNFEMAMYVAQATGSLIITDSRHRWMELQFAMRRRALKLIPTMRELAQAIQGTEFRFPVRPDVVTRLAIEKTVSGYPAIFGDAHRYAARLSQSGARPNWEKAIAARFRRVHAEGQRTIVRAEADQAIGKITCAIPLAGIQDNSINRLLLMSNSERHLPAMPMALFIQRPPSSGTRGGVNVLRRTRSEM